jgi:GNAT superfamily N-acetyltransferase
LIEILERPVSALTELRRACLAAAAEPRDGMWETFGELSRHYELLWQSRSAGYCCVNDDGLLLELWITGPHEHLAEELFDAIVARDDVRGALVGTADPLFLSLCLDRQRELRVHTLLFRDGQSDHAVGEDSGDSFDLVRSEELADIAALQRESLDRDPGDWLVGYVENLIARGELYALRQEGMVVATGEARISDTQPPFVDLGVITMRSHRGRGLAQQVLLRLKALCYQRRLEPICSTTAENTPARRAIAGAGFVSRHRLLEVGF